MNRVRSGAEVPISTTVPQTATVIVERTMKVPRDSSGSSFFSVGTFVFLIGVPLCVTSYLHMLWTLRMRRSMPFVLLLPYYWTFVGVAATCSFFKNTTTWGKTER